MARKSGSNKSQAIRDLLTANPGMGAKDVISTLANKGTTVNSSLVYFVKGKMNAGTQRRKKVARAAREASAANVNGDPLTLIRDIKALAAKSGGIGKLKALVEALAE